MPLALWECKNCKVYHCHTYTVRTRFCVRSANTKHRLLGTCVIMIQSHATFPRLNPLPQGGAACGGIDGFTATLAKAEPAVSRSLQLGANSTTTVVSQLPWALTTAQQTALVVSQDGVALTHQVCRCLYRRLLLPSTAHDRC